MCYVLRDCAVFFFVQYLFVSKLQLWRSGSAANDRDPQTSTAMDYH